MFSVQYNIPPKARLKEEFENHEKLERLDLPRNMEEKEVYQLAEKLPASEWYQIYIWHYDDEDEEEIIWDGNLEEFVYEYA